VSVLNTDLNGLVINLIFSENKTGDSSEFRMVRSLDILGEIHSIERIEVHDRLSQSFVILNFEVNFVQSIIYRLLILRLDAL